MNEHFAKLTQAMRRGAWTTSPRRMSQDEVSRRALICFLGNALRQMGLIPVPGWKPPKSTRDRVDSGGREAPDTNPPEIMVADHGGCLGGACQGAGLGMGGMPGQNNGHLSPRADKVKQSPPFS